MKIEELTFPVTMDDFLPCQETLGGQKLCPDCAEAIKAWIPAYNESYEEGRSGDKEALIEFHNKIDKFISEREDDPIISRFLESTRWWIAYAWDQGRRDAASAGTEMGGLPE